MTARHGYLMVVICGAILLTLSTGLRQTLGLFLRPMTIDLGIGRELFAFAIAASNLLWGMAGPFAGAVADKYGTGRTAMAGAVLYAAGLAAMGAATDGVYLIIGNILMGLALSGAGFSVVLGAVGRAAPPEQRSLALGLATAGGSFGQFAMVPYGQVALSAFGWSAALFVLAATALLMIPLASRLGDGGSGSARAGAQTLRQALAEAFSHSGFWLLTAGFFVCGFHVVFVGTHLPAYLADHQMPTWLGAWALATVGLFNIVGSYLAGLLGGRYRKKYLLSGIYFLRSVVFLLFLVLPITEATVLAFSAALGLLWLSTVPLTSGMVAQVFGPTYMSMLYAIVFLSHQVGSFLGAWLGGYVYDLTGSYDIVWWACVALGLISAALNYPIEDRPVPRLAAAPA